MNSPTNPQEIPPPPPEEKEEFYLRRGYWRIYWRGRGADRHPALYWIPPAWVRRRRRRKA